MAVNQSDQVEDLRLHKMSLNSKEISMPALGFGTLIPNAAETRVATKLALDVGFRTIDTAERYRTEKEVGEGLQAIFSEGKARREEVFVLTKLWNSNHRPERARAALEASLKKLGLDYVDCYLIHTPFAFFPGDDQEPRDATGALVYDTGITLLDTWRALETFVDEGKCRSIGLSDCKLAMAQTIYEGARVKPAVIQVESHPYNPEWELLDFCKQNGIVLQAFAPLGHSLNPRLLDDSLVVGIANELNKTPAQVLLAWALQRGTAVLTTSKTESRIKENFDVSAIPEEAMKAINAVDTRIRFNTVVETGVPGFIPGKTK